MTELHALAQAERKLCLICQSLFLKGCSQCVDFYNSVLSLKIDSVSLNFRNGDTLQEKLFAPS